MQGQAPQLLGESGGPGGSEVARPTADQGVVGKEEFPVAEHGVPHEEERIGDWNGRKLGL